MKMMRKSEDFKQNTWIIKYNALPLQCVRLGTTSLKRLTC
nr:MAG TPA: hypothetical protein [Caudoviricetes sp.]